MASVNDGSGRTSSEFAQSSVLEAIVPSNEDIEFESLFRAWDKEGEGSDETLLPFVEQRHFLLLGRQSLCSSSELASYSFTGL